MKSSTYLVRLLFQKEYPKYKKRGENNLYLGYLLVTTGKYRFKKLEKIQFISKMMLRLINFSIILLTMLMRMYWTIYKMDR
jgi:hypothetical protein